MSALSREWLLEKHGYLMQQLEKFAPLIARVFIGGFFLMAGLGKLADVQGFAGYVTMGGLPAFLAWPAIIF